MLSVFDAQIHLLVLHKRRCLGTCAGVCRHLGGESLRAPGVGGWPRGGVGGGQGRGWGGLGEGLCASARHRPGACPAQRPRRRSSGLVTGIRNPSCTVCARPTWTRTRTSMKQVSLSWSETAPSSARGALPETLVIHKDLAEGAEFYNITSLVKLAKDRIREGDSKTSQLRVTHVHRGLQVPGAELPQTGPTRPMAGGPSSSIGSSCNDRGAEQVGSSAGFPRSCSTPPTAHAGSPARRPPFCKHGVQGRM